MNEPTKKPIPYVTVVMRVKGVAGESTGFVPSNQVPDTIWLHGERRNRPYSDLVSWRPLDPDDGTSFYEKTEFGEQEYYTLAEKRPLVHRHVMLVLGDRDGEHEGWVCACSGPDNVSLWDGDEHHFSQDRVVKWREMTPAEAGTDVEPEDDHEDDDAEYTNTGGYDMSPGSAYAAIQRTTGRDLAEDVVADLMRLAGLYGEGMKQPRDADGLPEHYGLEVFLKGIVEACTENPKLFVGLRATTATTEKALRRNGVLPSEEDPALALLKSLLGGR